MWEISRQREGRLFLVAVDEVVAELFVEDYRASLIAAAPEMLEALEAICSEAESWHTMHDHDGYDCVPCDSICGLIPKMQAAIRKAKGE